MRNATILVVRLKGVATEAIKNVVLAGIGKLIIVDGENVSEEDLGAGFFFRDGDVGSKVRYSDTCADIYWYFIGNNPRDSTLLNQELKASIPSWSWRQ